MTSYSLNQIQIDEYLDPTSDEEMSTDIFQGDAVDPNESVTPQTVFNTHPIS